MPSLRQLPTSDSSNVKSSAEIDAFRSRLTTPSLFVRTEKIICSRMAWYVAIGQKQVLHAPSTSEAFHFSYRLDVSKLGTLQVNDPTYPLLSNSKIEIIMKLQCRRLCRRFPRCPHTYSHH